MHEPNFLLEKQATLEYWTLVEFFSPYNLDNHLNSQKTYQKIYAGDESSPDLPWLNASLIPEHSQETPFAKGYHLYLGLFSIEETADRARHTFAKIPSEWQSINWQSCSLGSCFARLTITTHGIPLFGTLTLSTLPWAHGRLLEGKKESIAIEQYWKSVHKLLHILREEFSLTLPRKLVKEPKTQAKYLDKVSISSLVNYLYDWAGYRPNDYPIALIEPLDEDCTLAAKDPQIKNERDIPILNSFYIQDLESAKISLVNLKGKPIDDYLGGEQQERIILDSPRGKETILQAIRPEENPLGRWPDPLSKTQSLMQQFSINAALDSSIFSVNGPPGTGKTSLLREIVAENLVRRAKALAQFKTAQQAFIGKQTINFESSDSIVVSELDPSLLGFEILVVSSNNKAVQNLSQELPLRSGLAQEFQHASYLETVATKALGVRVNESWGLISATLGNMENCKRFVENVFITPGKKKGEERIWEWIETYDGPSFEEAKDAFMVVLSQLEGHIEKLSRLERLHEEIGSHTDESYCREEIKALESIQEESEELQLKLAKFIEEEGEIKERLTLFQEKENLWKHKRPNPFVRIFDKDASKVWLDQAQEIRNQRMEAIDELHRCKMALKDLRTQLQEKSRKENDLTEELLHSVLSFHLNRDEYASFKASYPDALLPANNQELIHTHIYYQASDLNRVRTELFIAAMALHEAWLAEVLQMRGGFRGNLMAISSLLQGKTPTTADDTRLAWQSVFLLVPVISSTFASIGRIFRYLEPASIGWVLIDEAGQAVPQAAVGSIWRANRVLSIGDPFQIEPICTIPAEVIDGMAKIRNKDFTLSWAPSQVSVQNLMDRASIFGLQRHIREDSYWLGSPLRVHRRCLEPMFTIANSIAYESSMLLATPQGNEISLPLSCWWDVGGDTREKQYVPNQGKALTHLLEEALLQIHPTDLFVISPFREIVKQIQQLILETNFIKTIFEEKFAHIPLQQWVQQAVGTVHTFQGKQTTAVFFVLGGDKTTLRAIEWASRKPNLLNVAVTRAQSRFYVIGDYDLWKIWPYFAVAAKNLKRTPFSNSR